MVNHRMKHVARFIGAQQDLGLASAPGPSWRASPWLLVLLGLISCAHHLTGPERDEALRRSRAAIDPTAEPAPPPDPPADGVPEFNTEYYLGSQQAEQAQIADFGRQIQELQQQAASEHRTAVFRGFHAKSHGCLHGELRPHADRDERTRFGIFADSAPRPVWVRYSNGVGWKQADQALDARGMALKVMGVSGPKYLDDEQQTQDFLMTNSPTPVGKDAEEFMKFAHANLSGTVATVFFMAGHARSAGPALTRTGPIDSATTTQYWSGGAYHLGAHQAIKYTAKPCPGAPKRHPNQSDPDYLHQDLVAAARDGICYTFYVQFQADPEQTPIENAAREWTEDLSPLVAVADIVLPAQELASSELCDSLAFSPWHAIAAHKPMGHINRARRVVYAASQQLRGHGVEPKPETPPGPAAGTPAGAPTAVPANAPTP